MTFDLLDLALAAVVSAAVTIAIVSQKFRRAAIAVALLGLGVLTGRRFTKESRDVTEPTTESADALPAPIANPALEVAADRRNGRADVDRIPDDDLDAELAAFELRASGKTDSDD